MSENTIIAKGGTEMTVTLTTGNVETVMVKLLPLGKLPAFFESLDDDIKMMELVTGKSKTFCEAIDFESGMQLIELAHSVNFPRALRWAEAKANRLAPLAGIVKKGIALQRQLTT